MMTGTSVTAAKPLRQVRTVKELLVNDMAKGQLAAVAAQHMNPERMMRLIAGAIRTTPKLAECDPLTLLGAMMTCASIGLEPNTVLGHAYLIPFGRQVTLIIGYKGMIDLARRSGHVVSIHADVVYEGDQFSYEYGSDQHLRHVPEGARQNPTHAYCHAKLTDGEAFIVMPWDVVMGIRDGSQGYKTALKFKRKDTPWIEHTHQMARKTAVRALFNELPISVEKVSDALQVDDRGSDFAAFAMDPTSGVIEGETIDPDTGEVTETGPEDEDDEDDKPEPEPKKGSAKKAKPKLVAKDGAKGKPGNASGAPDPVKSLVLRVVDDLRSADQSGEIEATLELFGDQIALLKETAPDAYDEIMAEADAQRERLAA
jgi:recombination protein RecT